MKKRAVCWMKREGPDISRPRGAHAGKDDKLWKRCCFPWSCVSSCLAGITPARTAPSKPLVFWCSSWTPDQTPSGSPTLLPALTNIIINTHLSPHMHLPHCVQTGSGNLTAQKTYIKHLSYRKLQTCLSQKPAPFQELTESTPVPAPVQELT